MRARGPRTAVAGAALARAFGNPTPLRPPAALLADLKAKIRNAIPRDGELVFALLYEDILPMVGSRWTNYNESLFWIAAEHHFDHNIDEWMNSEFEGISDNLRDMGVDLSYGTEPGHRLAPDPAVLEDAFMEVCMEHPAMLFRVPVVDADDDWVEEVEISAQDLMDYYGLGRESIMPTIALADEVLPSDMADLEDDEEVYLDGYIVSRIDRGEFTFIHLVPPPQ